MNPFEGAGPGGFCEECGHMAVRHDDGKCLFPTSHRKGALKDKPCFCTGFTWRGIQYTAGSQAHDPAVPYV